MPRGIDDVHQRYVQQAGWTRAIRQRALAHFSQANPHRLLEVGSGTGAVLAETQQAFPAQVFGLDCDQDAVAFAHLHNPRAGWINGRAEQLPFAAASFDIVCCHFLLLWVADPLAVLLEMRRVTRPGGAVLCLAEPDYGGRIHHPESLESLGVLQEEALRAQGAETRLGRRLRALLRRAGLADVCAGVLGGEWPDDASAQAELDMEWRTAERDLANRLPTTELRRLRAEVDHAIAERGHVLFVPTFYAWGRRPAA